MRASRCGWCTSRRCRTRISALVGEAGWWSGVACLRHVQELETAADVCLGAARRLHTTSTGALRRHRSRAEVQADLDHFHAEIRRIEETAHDPR